MIAVTPDQSSEATARRRRIIQQTTAISRLEGLEPSAEDLELFERYINGEIDTKEWLAILETKHPSRTSVAA